MRLPYRASRTLAAMIAGAKELAGQFGRRDRYSKGSVTMMCIV